jgi:hypothetical protein
MRTRAHNGRKRSKAVRSPATGLQAALAASLALLDDPKAPSRLTTRVHWDKSTTSPVIAKETPRSLALQAERWRDIVGTLAELTEVACAIREWRRANTVEPGMFGLAVLAAHVTTLMPALEHQVAIMEDLSPTLRASMRRLEARQTKGGAA